MADLARLLATRPRELASLVAEPITFRRARPGRGRRSAADARRAEALPARARRLQPRRRLAGLPRSRGCPTAASTRRRATASRSSCGGSSPTTELAWVDDPACDRGAAGSRSAPTRAPCSRRARSCCRCSRSTTPTASEQRRLLVGSSRPRARSPTSRRRAIDAAGPTQPADTRARRARDRASIAPLPGTCAERAGPAPEPRARIERRRGSSARPRGAAVGPARRWSGTAIVTDVQPAPGPARELYDTLRRAPARGTTWRAALLAGVAAAARHHGRQRQDAGARRSTSPAPRSPPASCGPKVRGRAPAERQRRRRPTVAPLCRCRSSTRAGTRATSCAASTCGRSAGRCTRTSSSAPTRGVRDRRLLRPRRAGARHPDRRCRSTRRSRTCASCATTSAS